MSCRILLAAAAAMVVVASVSSTVDAKPKKNFYYLKNGQFQCMRAYKLRRNPPLYRVLHQVFRLGPQWGLTMNTTPCVGGGSDGSYPPPQSSPADSGTSPVITYPSGPSG